MEPGQLSRYFEQAAGWKTDERFDFRQGKEVCPFSRPPDRLWKQLILLLSSSREAANALPSSAKEKHTWSYVYIPQCVFVACTGRTL